MRIRQHAIIVLTLLTASSPTFAKYSVEVHSVPDFKQLVHSVAIMPALCPPDLDCLWLEKRIAEHLDTYRGVTVVPAERVRAMMFEMGVEHLDQSARAALSEKLKVDAFAVPLVEHSESQSSGMVGFWVGSTVGMVDTSVIKGKVELLIVQAGSGTVLVKGIGYGKSGSRTDKGTVFEIFRRIIQKAMRRYS